VGPKSKEWLVAPASEPIDDELPTDAFDQGAYPLSILLIVRRLSVRQTARIDLPPIGPSSVAVFSIDVPQEGGRLTLELSLIDRNRALQRLAVSGECDGDPSDLGASRLELEFGAIRPVLSDLRRRRPFDATLIVEPDPDGTLTTAFVEPQLGSAQVGPATIESYQSAAMDRAAKAIVRILKSAKDETLSVFLRSLALQGGLLFEELGRHIVRQNEGKDLSRLQVVLRDPDALLPVEFVYELQVPSNDARLCPHWRDALKSGRCPTSHPQAGAGRPSDVCPSGFWGVSKVIERHMDDMAPTPREAVGALPDPSVGPTVLRMTSALFAASSKVDSTSRQLVGNVIGGMSAKSLRPVTTWGQWRASVRQRTPDLLVLLSHSTEVDYMATLEIESEQRLLLAQIDSSYIKGREDSRPVLLLIGCDTGVVTDRQVQSFVTRFHRQGAAVVVGTLVPVRARDAALVVADIVMALDRRQEGAPPEARFGDIMTSVRRELLAAGQPLGLALTFFGDADWLWAS
jgi:hypothetical protein